MIFNKLKLHLFNFFEKLGYHITPNNFYSPIPDTRTLDDNLWWKQSKLEGIKLDDNLFLDLLYQFSSNYKDEYDRFPGEKTENCHFYFNNGLFDSVDAEVYYAMIRFFKPNKIIEVGAGFSTYVSSKAVLKNNKEFNVDVELIAIEPHPHDIIKGLPGLSKLIISKVQDIKLSQFKALKKNDILFIDSTHVLKVGSDVQYEILDILPNLNKGVIVHFHDIFLPKEYPKVWVKKQKVFWTEQYVLQAFLQFNNEFEIIWAGNFMHEKYPGKLEAAFKSYKNSKKNWVGPASFWIRRK